jgi:mono/diheme cytochrome c family protein
MRRNNLPIPAVAFLLCFVFAIVAGLLILHGSDDQANHVTVLGKRVALTKSQTVGHEIFSEHCASCPELGASRSIGQVGPNLDATHPSDAVVLHYVRYGGLGSYGDMPSGLATGPDLYAVASYVSHVANVSAYHP